MSQPNKSKRGGSRTPGPGKKIGHPGNEALGLPKRKKCSPTLAPGTKELAQAIAKERGYPGWGYAVDEAIRKLAIEIDQENGD